MSQAEGASEWIQEPAAEELQRNVLEEEQRKLREERRNFEREKKEFYFRKKMEEKRLGEEKRLFQLKWKVLEGELQKLAKEKQDMAAERERYDQRTERRSSYTFSGNVAEAEMFFSGVDNELELKKRYKELIKIYHPDNLSGDTGTLQMINKTYDILKKRVFSIGGSKMTNILEYLEQSAEKYPDKAAFADEENSCTWQELKERAQRIGTSLAGRIAPGYPVAVWMEKSVDAIAAFMGIVYAGCFYVMLDKKQPIQRIGQILNTLEQPPVLTDEQEEKEQEKLKQAGGSDIQILQYGELEQGSMDVGVLREIRRNGADIMPLYGIFTSGSTGVPKGVVVSHRSVLDFMDYFTDNFGITNQDVIGNQAPFDFDVSVKDIYSALKTGATVQLIPKRVFSFPTQLLDFLCERKVTTLIWAVSALCIVSELDGFSYRVPDTVNKVLFSGEVMPIHHLNIWRSYLPDAMYVNLYGPTEITCNCTYYIIDREFAPGDVLPIGKSFQNEKVFLLDEKDKLVEEPKVRGEICVSGTALSLGYYNNKEQTEKAFVQNPLNLRYPEIIYRTGDLGYYNENGELCYATRKDFQIKHMGHRIELGEIEQAMEKTGEVSRVCCMFDEDSRKIVAFYEGTGEKRAIVKELRKLIPPFMIPNVFCKRDGLPFTKNGKIDRASLKKSYQEEQQ